MKQVFSIGDEKVYSVKVKQKDTATFESGQVHPVYATFALGRDVEWAGRLFVLEMKEDHEEGIGTFLNIKHVSPALVGEEVRIVSKITDLTGNNVLCSFTAYVGDRVIAEGTQGQKILKKEKVEALFASLK